LPEFHVEVPSGRSTANQTFHHDAFSHGFIMASNLGVRQNLAFSLAAAGRRRLTHSGLHDFGEVRLCGVTVYRRIAEDKKNPMRHTIAFIVAALLAVAPVAYGKKKSGSFSRRSSAGTKPRIGMLHSGSSNGRQHRASSHRNRAHKRS
jgi:hypothetical protein